MRYSGVIFDLDGVLCSTDRFHFEAWKQTAREINAPFDERINQRLRGVSRMESLEIILGGSPLSLSEDEKLRLAEEKNERYRALLKNLTHSDLVPGAEETLAALRAAGVKLAVGSSSKNAVFILERLGARELFDAVCDGTMILRSKPDPEVFLKAAEMLGEAPRRCLVVEDAAAGLEAARSGGMDCAIIGGADMPFEPEHRIDGLGELRAIVLG